MKRSQEEGKGGKRVKKQARPSRSGIRWAFVLCCCLAVVVLAVWKSGVLSSLWQKEPTPAAASSVTSVEPDVSTPVTEPTQSDEAGGQVTTEPVQEPEQGTEEETPWNLILVNRWNPLPEDYQVELVTLSNGTQVDERIYPSLQKMFDAARADGVYPIVASGYRTPEKQQSLMDEKIAEYKAQGYSDEKAKTEAEKWVAIPGTSEHQLGLAVDINADGINSAGYEVYDWLDQHAQEYGFIRRFPESKTEITGISNEPWHYRYVGKKVAAEIHDRGICLEEYLNKTEHE